MSKWLPFCLVGLLAAILFLGTVSPAPAADYGGYYRWFSPYPADLTDLYNVGRIPTPPYFALNPPVYYSLPVPRTYGYSPYAYPPYVRTPEIAPPGPKVIQNRYVPRPGQPAPTPEKSASVPLRIINPYVVGTGSGSNQARLAAGNSAAGL